MKTPFVKPLFVATLLLFLVRITAPASTPLGIGIVLDSATNLTRSFTLYELMNKNALIHEGDTLKPALTAYPISFQFAITGVFKSKHAEFRIYHNGKKVKEIQTQLNWKDVYQKIAAEFADF